MWLRRLDFSQHINLLKTKLTKDLQLLKLISKAQFEVPQECMRKIIMSMCISKIKYGIEIYGRTSKSNRKRIDAMINHFIRMSSRETLNIIGGIDKFDTLLRSTSLQLVAWTSANSFLNFTEWPTIFHPFHIFQQYMEHPNGGNNVNYEVFNTNTVIPSMKSIKHQIRTNIFDPNSLTL